MIKMSDDSKKFGDQQPIGRNDPAKGFFGVISREQVVSNQH